MSETKIVKARVEYYKAYYASGSMEIEVEVPVDASQNFIENALDNEATALEDNTDFSDVERDHSNDKMYIEIEE